ncbi:alpha-1,6-mannosyl-glycoprotein 2-beta-N-acetylglucosaminyltransferase isoform X1 [Sitophilus oryzae]|uniref:Alpha-1,6-mannosyl-glycoprotein 2-beta-N-acetylglucosaminyltransferase n=1 Tax=Sitophilus oryzae TaxID=7048 RepID=A0A6J2XAN9_SITOR|nr:alpha-1,6-mannosyl-glycoprotein 2-beta-N-acetylglucosaminyltransferase isoform X1 [Sitophilus oryzae]XP_030748349.1 alpha-1,6-mannosyl-glycoprotein 2-beta-N-acetylglucosaminyltransferase isoform X1 [Sitophilus oryzae]
MSSGRSQIWRRRTTFWIRAGLILFIVIFVWVQVSFVDFGGSVSTYSDINDSQAAILSMVPVVLHKFLAPKPKNMTNIGLNGSYNNLGYYKASLNISDIKRNIAQYNLQQTVYNEDLFGPLQNDSIVIVIQIHDRITYLRHLIVSLAQARDISQALIVFSHDYYDEEINNLVQSVDFCKVIQIFYPYSIQTHPHEFPGEDPSDCPRDMKKDKALKVKCNNALYPDLYGHYREAKFTQTKHHWWWKVNRVFNQLEVTRNHTGLVLFLEEDHYVAEDFIHILRLMERTCKDACRHCNILSLGTYLKTYNYYGDSKKREALRAKQKTKKKFADVQPSWTFQVLPSLYQHPQKVEITPWISSKHNMGMAFNRSTWNGIVRCAAYFCKYDDYNWDWSLQHISQNCLKQKLHAMVARGPRVFHIGECGVHHKKNNCGSTAVISKVQQVLKSAKRHLYPDYLILNLATVLKKTKLRKGNGGWGDYRDHKLCMSMTIR